MLEFAVILLLIMGSVFMVKKNQNPDNSEYCHIQINFFIGLAMYVAALKLIVVKILLKSKSERVAKAQQILQVLFELNAIAMVVFLGIVEWKEPNCMDIDQNISVVIFVVIFFFLAVRKMPREIRDAVRACRLRSH